MAGGRVGRGPPLPPQVCSEAWASPIQKLSKKKRHHKNRVLLRVCRSSVGAEFFGWGFGWFAIRFGDELLEIELVSSALSFEAVEVRLGAVHERWWLQRELPRA